MFQAGLKVHSFLYCVVILVALSHANIMSEIEFSRLAVSDRTNLFVFETYSHVDIVDCVRECREIDTCKFINYNTRMKLCTLNHFTHLFMFDEVHKEKAPGNACWLRPSSIPGMYGYFGSDLNTCSTGNTCEIKYCGVHRTLGSFEHNGNMYAVGSKQAYGCLNHSTNTMYKQIFYCEPNGEWSLEDTPCSYTNIVATDDEMKIYYISDVRVSQSEAAKRCEKEHAHLLRVTRVKQFEDIEDHFGNSGRVEDLWIDAHKHGAGDWRTSDGQEIDKSVRALRGIWNFFGDRSCATSGFSWQLLPTDCTSSKGYICETDAF